MRYDLQLANPKEFYNEIHRPDHFLRFSQIDTNRTMDVEPELENLLEWLYMITFFIYWFIGGKVI